MRKIFTLSAALIIGFAAQAQDIHFSQYLSSPLNLNPATAGVANADFRVISNYRNQWKSVSPDPYSTIAASIDGTLPPKRRGTNFWGMGLQVNSDKAGASNLKTASLNLAITYSLVLNPKKSSIFSIGFQGGVFQRSIDPANLTWDNQYNGIRYDPNLPSGESFAGIALVNPDMSAGLLYNISPNNNFRFQTGAAIFHVTRPNISLSFVGKDPLNIRFAYHAVGQIIIPKHPGSSFIPSLIYFRQGPESMINFGGAWRVRLKEESRYTGWESEVALQGGLYYRFKDATFVNFRLDWSNFSFGVNYDFNVSSLQVASNSKGGMEFFVMYQKGLLAKAKYNPKVGLKMVQY